MRARLRSAWGWPLALALLSAAGLAGGLLGDGAWDGLAWLGLGAPCAAGIGFGLRGRARAAGDAHGAHGTRCPGGARDAR